MPVPWHILGCTGHTLSDPKGGEEKLSDQDTLIVNTANDKSILLLGFYSGPHPSNTMESILDTLATPWHHPPAVSRVCTQNTGTPGLTAGIRDPAGPLIPVGGSDAAYSLHAARMALSDRGLVPLLQRAALAVKLRV